MKQHIILIFFVALLAACSGNEARKQEAAALVAQARALADNHNYDSALTVLDTLNVKYRDCLEERREGTMVRLNAMGALTRDSIASAELQLRAVTARIDSLAPAFKKVDIQGTEGFFVDKSVYTGNEMNSNGIQARIDEQGYCFIVANVEGRRIGLNQIIFDQTSTPPIESVSIEGSEIMSVTQEPATALLNALSEAKANAKIILSGLKGKIDITLNAKQLGSIRATWEYAQALQQQRALNIRLEKLERQLAKLNDQIASQIKVDEPQN